MRKKTIEFIAVSKDGELLADPCKIYMECSEANIIGEERKTVYNPRTFKYGIICGFWVGYKGVEYSTIEMNQDQFINACNGGCGTPGDTGVRLFGQEFEILFQ